MSDIVRVVSFYIKCQPTVFIVFSYRRLSDVMCVDRHWKLVYRCLSAHITLLVEHTPISGSFMFFSITIIRIIRGRQKKSVEISVIRGKRKNHPVHTHEAVILCLRVIVIKQLVNSSTCQLVYLSTKQSTRLLKRFNFLGNMWRR